MSIRYLTARLAQQIDEELMGAAGAFSLDQASGIASASNILWNSLALRAPRPSLTVYDKERYPRVLVCCGPGNQGGDGLVAARHLGMFGYKPVIWMPKVVVTTWTIPTLPAWDPSQAESTLSTALASSDVVLDAIFGFSFQPPVRAPFDAALPLIARANVPIVVRRHPRGDAEGRGLRPDVLVSLTAPKEGVRRFAGRHFLGGRFVSRSVEERYELNLPGYPGVAQVVELAR
ncbi:YjeF N-terminal domain-like protein [Lactarius sanguifluus]|nr:YjeF N-terminal domain-like protein [Lactarius sanguifluus]